jgi:hypothetical protein
LAANAIDGGNKPRELCDAEKARKAHMHAINTSPVPCQSVLNDNLGTAKHAIGMLCAVSHLFDVCTASPDDISHDSPWPYGTNREAVRQNVGVEDTFKFG